MNFIFLILASALALGIADIISKHVLTKRHSMEFNAARSVMMLFFLVLLLPFVIEPISFKELIMLYVISVLFSIELHLFSRALRHLDISIASPLMELSPIFLVVLATLFLDESLAGVNILGVILLIFGAIIVSLDLSAIARSLRLIPQLKKDIDAPPQQEAHTSVFTQLKDLFSSHYVHLVLFAALLGAIVGVMQKSEIASIRPIIMGFYIWLFVSINLITYYLVSHRFADMKIEIRDYGPKLLIIAVLTVGSSLLYLQALPAAFVSVVLPLRRMSALFAVVIGGNLFAEKQVLLRAIAACIMVVGAVLVLI
jgi:uncharacterized membrane protein